ncbi:MAG: response regulator, partial [Acidobacteriota bacterium]
MSSVIKVLLIEDDEDDYILVKGLLSEVPLTRFAVDWISNYEKALETACRDDHDIILLDYRLGKYNGLQLMQEIIRRGCRIPVILLTGQGDYEVDVEAMRCGAADYLVKNQISVPLIERSIRHAIERKKAQDELSWEASLNTAIADLSHAILSAGSIDDISELVLERTKQLSDSTSGFTGYLDPESGTLLASTAEVDGRKGPGR